MTDHTLLKAALTGLIAYELGTGNAGVGSGRGQWYARGERPVVYWLLVAAHVAVLAALVAADWRALGHP